MSYILEALKRADAERARGAVPGLNTPAADVEDDESPATPRPWLWLLAGVVVALGVVLAWRWAATSDLPQAPIGVVAQAPAVVTPTVTPQEATTAAAQPPVVQPGVPGSGVSASEPAATSSAIASATVPSPAPTPPTAPRSTDGRAETPSTPEPRRATVAREAPARKSPSVVAPAASAVARAEPARRIYRQAELPDEIRRALPRITIGGSIYSESAASRMIVINGQVLHEGEKLGPDLELHQIRMKEAVLDFRGYRYEVPY